MEMDSQTKLDIERAVLSILENADMNDMTEAKVRTSAAEKLGRDLSKSVYKKFVRGVIENYLTSRNSAEDEEEEEEKTAKEKPEEDEEEDEKASKRQQKQKHVQAEEEEEEADEEEEQPAKKPRRERAKPSGGLQEATVEDNGDIVICKLSSRRSVTIQNFRGQKLVSIREYYTKDGKELPSQKGISLTLEQWEAFKKGVPAIEEAIEKVENKNE